MRLKTKKSFSKSIQVFLVCLVILGGGLGWNGDVKALSLYGVNPHNCDHDCGNTQTNVVGCCNKESGALPEEIFDHAQWGGITKYGNYYSYIYYPDDNSICPFDCSQKGDDLTDPCLDICPHCVENRCRIECVNHAIGNIRCWYREPPPTCTLTANPVSINSTESSDLTWSSSASAVSGSINQGIGNVATSGGMSVSPGANTTYTLTVVNSDGGTGTCTATVTVTAPAPPPPGPNNACGIGTNVLCNPLDPKVPFFVDGIMVVILFLLSLAGIVTLTSIVIAGIKYITSAGDAERMKSAKDALLSSGFGLVIILLAFTILSVIHGILNG